MTKKLSLPCNQRNKNRNSKIRIFTSLANTKKNNYTGLLRGVGNGPSPTSLAKELFHPCIKKPLERSSLDSTISFPEIYPSSTQIYGYKNIYDGSGYDGKQLESSLSIERGLVQ